jgi:hypothetical protein
VLNKVVIFPIIPEVWNTFDDLLSRFTVVQTEMIDDMLLG